MRFIADMCGEIFDKAIAESRVVVTFDLDFSEIVAFAKGRKAGVILFRLRNTRTSFVIQRLSDVISVRKKGDRLL